MRKKLMAKLRAEARAILAAYTPDGDFEETVMRLASVGYRMEAAKLAA